MPRYRCLRLGNAYSLDEDSEVYCRAPGEEDGDLPKTELVPANAISGSASVFGNVVANQDYPYKMRESFPEALVTFPGKSYPNSDLIAGMCKLDSGAAEGCEPQTVVAENVSERPGSPCLGL